MKKNKLAIFDLDGTLFDTSKVNFLSYKNAIIKSGYKFNLSEKEFNKITLGKSYDVFLPLITPEFKSKDLDKIHEIKKKLYKKFLNNAIMNKPLFDLIDSIKSSYYTAIVSTASRKNALDILNEFNVAEKFDLIITNEDVIQQKPSPEGFNLAIKKFKVSKNNVIIFEDSKTGIQAAKKSGAFYLKVSDFSGHYV